MLDSSGPRPGPLNSITDIPGLSVGHATDEQTPTGVTVLLCDGAWAAGVDVRGGGPGTREIDVLSSENLVGRVHAVVLSGGSVFGLAAADGVTYALSRSRVGLRLGGSSVPAIPIVPAAVLHDLNDLSRTDWGDEPPYRRLGREAVAAAGELFAQGAVGAGRAARAGVGTGGIGSASLALEDGVTVGALVAANPMGSVFMPDGRTFWAWPFEIDNEFGGRRPTTPMNTTEPVPDLSRLRALGRVTVGGNTTLAIVAASADLTSAECKRLAMMAQDGLARAIRPVHTPFDGDTVFAVAHGRALSAESNDRAAQLTRLGSAAADCLARAIARAVYQTEP
ncbi:P1 family peptidase [Telmatospirillum siberiense]|uniref:Peptidase T4 n=1 Tax=Telmatospirillum siberiense TaxID=382514 RepID=A0A2N3PV56_9PROT|nr:P1 family peptidase [Telmatospirillum siberiense]PKU24277.1 peptidase T4 [Telmatospirillum siberiense]